MMWATFDCYGTLIDWEAGLRTAFADLWPEADPDELLRLYHLAEADAEAGSDAPYRDVLRSCLARVAASAGLSVPAGHADALAASLPSWPVFAEVPDALRELRRRGARVAILSNTDPALLAASIANIGVEPDLCVTAAEAGGYKPAHGHWLRFREQAGPERQVHVAASLFHDVAPCAELGIDCVWINRLGESSDLPRAAELTDLAGLPDVLDALR